MHSTSKLNDYAQQGQDMAEQAVDEASSRIQTLAKQGRNRFVKASKQVTDTATQVSDSVIGYTQENPVKALLIAAAAGAALLTLVKLVTPSRD